MRHFLTYFALVLLCAGMGSCSKSSGSAPAGTMSATIDGNQWSTNNATATSSTTGGSQLKINIEGKAGNGTVNLVISPFTGPGTYTITASQGTYYQGGTGVYNLGISGQVVVTDSHSAGNDLTVIKGNFTFTTDNSNNISNGTFYVSLLMN